MNAFAQIPEALLDEEPIFFVEAPDGQKHLTELDRVQTFRKLMRRLARGVEIEANANAGKRSRTQARKEGVRGGVFDYTIAWRSNGRGVAWLEFKGYSRSTSKSTSKVTFKAGSLQQNQIDWGNARTRIGHDVACFFDPMKAIEWLRERGCPVDAVL